MVQILDRKYLLDLLTEKRKHDTGNALDILPFSSRRAKEYRTRYNSVLGELIRIICELEVDNKKLSNKEFFYAGEDTRQSEHIANNVEFDNEDEKFDFIRFLNEYMFNNNEIKPIHPFLFNYLETDRKNKNEIAKFSQFINDILVNNNKEIKLIFNNKNTDDILTELILSKLDSLKEMKTSKQVYEPLMSPLIKLYQEDITYLSKYKDYFLTSFPLLTQYYTFMYVCQLIIKFEQFTLGDLEKVQPLYFALDWESINKRRQPASEIEGFRFVKNKSINLFPHVQTLSQLSHNSLNQELSSSGDKLRVFSYGKLYQLIKDRGVEFEAEFFRDLKNWIQDYQDWKGIKVEDKSESIPEAFKVLNSCLKVGMNTDVCEKYGKNIEDLGATHFIKSRGSLGQILNIKLEFLLLLTAVSIKDKRIPLNELFVEFEKRGVKFDRYSKKEIINKFDSLNILDKKSDSGDSQYVNPIL